MMKPAVEVIFNSILKAATFDYDYTYAFNCSLDVPYKKETYLGFKVIKWRLLEKNTIIFTQSFMPELM